jgi:uncharacterized protein
LARERTEAEARLLWESGLGAAVPFEHRWEHVRQVVGLALRLADELGADAEIVEAAAWLHDICKAEPQHARAGATEAARFLQETDFPPDKRAAVVDAIEKHEGFYRPVGAPPLAPLEAAVLWDADKLSKLGVAALAITLGAPYVRGKSLAERRRYVDDFARDVLSRTVESMNTEPGRRLARVRYDAMKQTLDAWAREETEDEEWAAAGRARGEAV